jgi:hypothetical protein
MLLNPSYCRRDFTNNSQRIFLDKFIATSHWTRKKLPSIRWWSFKTIPICDHRNCCEDPCHGSLGSLPGSFRGKIGFNASSVRVGFVEDNVAPWQVFLGIFNFYSVSLILSILYTLPFIEHRHCIIFAIASVIKQPTWEVIALLQRTRYCAPFSASIILP